ncbi:MAG: 2OG-Fe(II) oxygenase, partial [Planctomycetaceae bacterium]|nr:2OG-Fe(II) oxygenase [Planctomycetaceae bacterium]
RPGEQFRRHEDFAHEWNDRRRTFLTVLIYLNQEFTGGETWFEEENLTVTPQTGTATIFPHELIHAGCPVVTGIKYALRSDVIFVTE